MNSAFSARAIFGAVLFALLLPLAQARADDNTGKIFKDDSTGRITGVDHPNAKKTRRFVYDNGGKLQEVTIDDKAAGTVRRFQRSSTANIWYIYDARGNYLGEWRGQITVDADGVYAYKTDAFGSTPGDRYWQCYAPDGTEYQEYRGENGQRAQLDKAGRLLSASVKDGKLQAEYTNGAVSSISRTAGGVTKTYTKNPDGTWSNQGKVLLEVSFNADGVLTVKDRYGVWTQQSSGSTTLRTKNGATVQFDANERPCQIRTDAGDERSFEFADDGTLVKITDKISGSEDTTERAPGASGWTNVALSPSGSLSYTDENGLSVVESESLLKTLRDPQGRLLELRHPDGSARKLIYTDDELAQVEDTYKTPSGELKQSWKREVQGQSAFVFERGTDQRTYQSLTVTDDGVIEYVDSGTKRSSSLVRLTGAVIKAQSVIDQRDKLIRALFDHLNEQRILRLLSLMNGFEQRMMHRSLARQIAGIDADKARTEIENAVADTYLHLYEMVAAKPARPFFQTETRVMLAETFLHHACDPSATEQGLTNTCWIESSYIAGGFVSQPHHLARVIREVAVAGTYTTLNGGEGGGAAFTKSFSKSLFDGMFNGAEAQWNMDTVRQDGRSIRSPVSLILDQVLPVLGGRPEFGSDWGNYWGTDGCRNIMYMVTGTIVCDSYNLVNNSVKQTLVYRGGYITYLPGHMRSQLLLKDEQGWYILQDDQVGESRDTVIERIPDLKQWLSTEKAP